MPDQSYSNSTMDALFQEAKLDSPEAMQVCFDKYARVFLTAIRARMDAKLRSAWDSTDFMQRTRQELFLAKIEKLHFSSPAAFVAYVRKIAENQVLAEKRKMHNRLNAAGKIQALPPDEAGQLVNREPSAHDELAVEEKWKNVIVKLSPLHQGIANRLRECYKHTEIAAEFGVSDRTVRNVLADVRTLLATEMEKGN